VVSGDGSDGGSSSKASFTIDPGGTLKGSSTYSSGSFKIENTSSETQKIKSLKIDLSSGVLPDTVFDPNGTAGDTTAKCLTADSGAAETGYVSPADKCKDPFSQPHDGNANDGYDVATVSFNDFDPGEVFTFSVDVDPTSIKGYSGSGGAGSVSGLELTGALATVGFDDGSAQTAQTFRIPSSVSGSQNELKDNPPAKPAIEVVGVSAPAKVQQADQTVRVSGPAGSAVSLMVLEGGMFTEPPNGFYDLDPYEANSVVKVTEKSATIGSGGTVDIPVSLTKSSTEAGLNYMVAVIKDASGRSGPLSNVLVLELTDADTVGECTITGTDASETLTGTEGDDVICALGGSDTIHGLGGNDILIGANGNDKLYGGSGDDTLDGGAATDTANFSGSPSAVSASLLSGSATGDGSDTLIGIENLTGSKYADTLTGSDSKNNLTGGSGSDTLNGEDGADKLTGGGANDLVHGGLGDDTVVGSGGPDDLFGDEGDDTVNSKDTKSGNDSLDGGPHVNGDTAITDDTEESIVGFP
jgi:Ca2+-binding RTX toxin-like protein